MSAAKRLLDRSTGGTEDDFYSIILKARKMHVRIPEEDIWGSRVVDD